MRDAFDPIRHHAPEAQKQLDTMNEEIVARLVVVMLEQASRPTTDDDLAERQAAERQRSALARAKAG